MRVQRHYRMPDDAVARFIDRHGWALLITEGTQGLRAAHLPCLVDGGLESQPSDLVILGHTARADPQSRDIGDSEALLIFQGPHGYISPSWYEAGPYVPTWNYTAVHVYGVPQLLEGEEAFSVLERTVEHFEAAFERPWQLTSAMDYARRIAPGVVAFRLSPTRVEAKSKLSQDKPGEVQDRGEACL